MLAEGSDLEPDNYPNLYNFSAAFFVKRLPVDMAPVLPEYVYVPLPPLVAGLQTEERVRLGGAIAEWNSYWETGRFRADLLAERMPAELSNLAATTGHNIFLMPDDPESRYEAYAPLFHLLPRRVLERFGLPLLRRGCWPYLTTDHAVPNYLPDDFGQTVEGRRCMAR